ncbi:aminotransferase class I/II-fold pyridoxal phosphate-dependent enzyme [Streptomyces sp. SID13666]|uniref:aminotransferase class I/II-fold pyridoxal phosphate-dependent enzyme n=1 Tax=Streptomyces TaxID=1883 RepID=UPI001106E4E6|nr:MULTISPECIES: aminotransferase class I/II-fold pyridoxal phosphate-dependent enzyme [Streptomyces]MCZ4099038.1 aminotransferase class I/II-fold pyridoxal phosphate-dependent enzyme [Streptomyces sp. H39-C1]NEA59435.1 aminotransferase class I/II-fold pyridoxal phosphate-dependent enzyme [Streptomyces sp. SID13666]NEA72445.1 aminotransferase class I/II-fold pyridoxal phosphate-dependent enzyme [Streptomyces sp. SID13588]QNA74473.1 aminotransferase class I/II-fold pyridoxal phosphate-dependent 
MGEWSPAARVRGVGTSIFTEMTELARRTGAVNLGQGVPELASPATLLKDVAEAVLAGNNQYPPATGFPALRTAVAEHQLRRYGLDYRPDGEVLITTGATEAIAAALLAFCDPGDEVLAFDPCYDAYPAAARLSGATLVGVPLEADGDGFVMNADALRAAVTPRTRVLVLNTPHNPMGKVFTAAELDAIADVCREHSLIVVTDEVYEHLVYDETPHRTIAALPGMRERTLIISSAGKTFNVTGWKIGWICGPAPLVAAAGSVKQFLTYASGTPYQEALARMLGSVEEWAAELRGTLRTNRDLLSDGLKQAGLRPYRAEAGYFLQADVRPWGYTDGVTFCRELPERAGVVAIPTSAFYQGQDAPSWLVRFSFCKREESVRTAVDQLVRAR